MKLGDLVMIGVTNLGMISKIDGNSYFVLWLWESRDSISYKATKGYGLQTAPPIEYERYNIELFRNDYLQWREANL